MQKLTGWDILVVVILLGVAALNGSTAIFLLCVIAFFLWLHVRPRKTIPAVVAPAETKPGCTSEQVDNFANGPEFPLGESGSISLNEDIGYQECKNHFLVHGHSPDRQSSTYGEFEYRLEGTDVFVRELHRYSKFINDPERWSIRDGVVLESQLRKEGLLDDDDIASLKQDVEWVNLRSTRWHGFKYFVVSKNVSTPDARRFFRQELERLRTGFAAFQKLNVKPNVEALQKCGLTWQEFHSLDKVVEQLEGLLGENK